MDLGNEQRAVTRMVLTTIFLIVIQVRAVDFSRLSDITGIRATNMVSGASEFIDLPRRVDALVSKINQHGSGWGVPWYGVPVPEVALTLFAHDKPVLAFGIGDGFFTAHFAGRFYSKPATAVQAAQVIDLLSQNLHPTHEQGATRSSEEVRGPDRPAQNVYMRTRYPELEQITPEATKLRHVQGADYYDRILPTSTEVYDAIFRIRSTTITRIGQSLKERFPNSPGIAEYAATILKQETVAQEEWQRNMFELSEAAKDGGMICEFEWDDGTRREVGLLVVKSGKIVKRQVWYGEPSSRSKRPRPTLPDTR